MCEWDTNFWKFIIINAFDIQHKINHFCLKFCTKFNLKEIENSYELYEKYSDMIVSYETYQ